jgi:hypothetical protein
MRCTRNINRQGSVASNISFIDEDPHNDHLPCRRGSVFIQGILLNNDICTKEHEHLTCLYSARFEYPYGPILLVSLTCEAKHNHRVTLSNQFSMPSS